MRSIITDALITYRLLIQLYHCLLIHTILKVVFLMADGDCRSRRKSNMRHEALSHTPFGAETNKIVITSALLDVSSNASEELSVLNTRETTAYSLITGN